MSNAYRTATISLMCSGFATAAALAQAQRHDQVMTQVKAQVTLHVPQDFATIQEAIDAAHDGEAVMVWDGIYTGPGNVDLDFQGKAITVRSWNGPSACVLDCDASPADPHRGFNFHSGEGPDSVVEGFTIRNGSTPSGAVADVFNGAGILCTENSSPTIRNCTITSNWAGCWGAAVCCSFQSHPTIENCSITGNYSDDDGGGVFAWSGSKPTIVNSIIAGNEARVTGGGISLFGGSSEITIINSTIVNNVAPFGAGMLGFATVTHSIIWGNVGDVQINGNPLVSHSVVAGGYPGPGNMDVDPLFVDALSGDYHLRADSLLIDAGDPAFEPLGGVTDIDGEARLNGDAVDLGADEVNQEEIFSTPQPKTSR